SWYSVYVNRSPTTDTSPLSLQTLFRSAMGRDRKPARWRDDPRRRDLDHGGLSPRRAPAPDIRRTGPLGYVQRKPYPARPGPSPRSEEHTSELQSRENLVCRLLLEKKNN